MAFGFKEFIKGIRLVPVSSTAVSVKGDLELLDSSSKINFFNGTTASPLVSEAHAASLTNKTLASSAANPSTVGIIRLGNTESVGWRNAANSANKLLTVNASDQLQYDGNTLLTSTGSLTASRVLVTDASSVITSSSVTTTTLGFLDATSSIQTQLNSKAPTASPTFTGIATFAETLFNAAQTSAQVSTPSNPSAGQNKLYFKSDNSLYSLNSSGIETKYGTEFSKNYLLNSNFDFWQRGTSVTVANNTSTYQADRWYVQNSLGTNGVITYSRVAGVSDGAKYGAQVQITTAPTALQTNGTELYQTLENLQSLDLYNKSVCFSVKVKALGNVNQCGIQFFYRTTEGKVNTSIGSEQTATVNTGTFTTITISGQALGTSMTTSGVIGVRIRITGVSSGNTYDLNNGFVVEQAMLNLGSAPATYQRACETIADEFNSCQRYYEKSYRLSDAPGTATFNGAQVVVRGNGTANVGANHQTYKRSTTGGTIVFYSPNNGASGVYFNHNTGTNQAATLQADSEHNYIFSGAAALNEALSWQYTADYEI